MISVVIFINGNPIMGRSATRIGNNEDYEINEYQVDDGTIVKHTPEDGAVELAKKMLDIIKEKK